MTANMSRRSLKARLEVAYEEVEMLERRVNEVNQKIRVLKDTKIDLERDLSEARRGLVCLKELRLIIEGLPAPVRKLRRTIVAKMKQCARGDITIDRRAILSREIADTKKSLEGICRHPLVFSYDGYRGSYDMDFDNSRLGQRVCAVCCFSDSSKRCDEDDYPTLYESPIRLVKRDLRENRISVWPKFVFLPIPEILELFKRSVGSNNLSWLP